MDEVITHQVKALRAFNRSYTQSAGLLEPYLDGPLSLTEVRVLYELAHREQCAASEIGRVLGLDAGYLSRILKRFAARGWLQRGRSPADGRLQALRMTPAGHAAFAPLQQKSRDAARALLERLSSDDRAELVDAMAKVERLLVPPAASTAPRARTAVLREPRPGDIGWVVQQHGELYAREYGLDARFEALVADIAARFVRNFRPGWERCWIAELNGERVGSVFLARKSATVAQLRLLILTPAARGMGLGARLTDECLAFARARGYRKIVLWTNSCLSAARSIYAARGFVLTKSEPYEDFGQSLVGETWELKL
nr:bifunctional helix-turn-helix transcriptional regulator/GNAT family N-acetyltransferase [Variovorax boronicumulans]